MPDVAPSPACPSAGAPGDPVTGSVERAARPLAATGRLLGLDLGSRRIGVAVSDSQRRLATGVTAIARRDPASDHRTVADLVDEYEAVGVIVGVPLSLSGAAGPAARAATAEVEQLRATLDVPVDTVDERLTTVQASAGMRAAGRRSHQQRSVIDQQAAAGLLQTWLEQHREGG
ncbi:Holliday junction resolvase RuvX [Acidiferrimicrobium sp. IK]|uniref:Holliday junction resolvase RuvX n=1 Tax=Acidiferrimicrobium sp. IK TaxID=2871700 RepID=UPI0021CB6012|nr:Holliday junction resolvase RuvX [Acidiferrimicrobium sp. IK]MCU4184838.1 Holliday junction resolvase RuvX [Acidiferrimicrobium sp. IK]